MAAMKVGTDSILLGAWAESHKTSRILDIGSGTGLLALMMAQKYPDAIIDAVELDRSAYNQSILNFEKSQWSNRVKAHHTDIQEYHPHHAYDLIICNPPFFTEGLNAASQARDKARNALFLKQDQLAHSAFRLLDIHGRFFIILPITIGEQFCQLAKKYELFLTKKINVYTRVGNPVERLLLMFEKKKRIFEVEELTIHLENSLNNAYSDEFISITKDFYLYM